MPRRALNPQKQIRGRRHGVMKKANDIYEMYGYRYLVYVEDSDGKHLYKSDKNWLPDVHMLENLYLPSNFVSHADAMRAAQRDPQVTASAIQDSPPVLNPYTAGLSLPGTASPTMNSTALPQNIVAPVFSSPASLPGTSLVQTPDRQKTRAEARRMTLTEKGDVYGFQKIEQDEEFVLMSSLEEFKPKN